MPSRVFRCAASCSLGAAWASIDHTSSYLQQRVQFGRPLAEFQVRPHQCGELDVYTVMYISLKHVHLQALSVV